MTPKPLMIFTWTSDPGLSGKATTKAAVWSSNPKDFDRGLAYAEKQGYQVHLLPDSSDVLAIARSNHNDSHELVWSTGVAVKSVVAEAEL
jgi:hypothetical protein